MIERRRRRASRFEHGAADGVDVMSPLLPLQFDVLAAEPRTEGPSEASVDTHCPAKGIEDTGNEDAPLAMAEGGIKPERLHRQTDDETPPTPAAQ